jgi:WS/DGAT/MGAT family acyltransferase
MERLTGLDASFLYFETPEQHMHVLATIVFDPSTVIGGYRFENVKEMIRSRLHTAAPLRRRLMTVPFNIGNPVWVEDPEFDLDYHVRRIGCPAPGTEVELAEVAADIAGRKLDRTRPLWEMWVIEGLASGHVAVVAKMHHSTIDGVSGANMMVNFFDLSPEGRPEDATSGEWKPERRPSEAELTARALLSRTTAPLKVARIIPRTIRAATNFAMTRRRAGRPGMPTPFTAPRTSFNAQITPHRRVAYAQLSLEDVKAVKRAFGTTVNDVVLAITAGALRRYLDRRGERFDKSLIAVCPVSVHGDPKMEGTNRVSAMFCTLATDVDDPIERLRVIAEANKAAKEEHNAIGADFLQDWASFAAPTTFSLAARLYSSLRFAERVPPVHNLVISNVPGPRIPLYFAGARLVELYPLGPIFHGAGLNITVVSYMDTLCWGLIACRESSPDLWDLAATIPEALAELRKAADETGA